jgi:hypothetical protein
VFSKIDLCSGYHQIKIPAKDIPKTAFIMRYGLHEYLVISFGLLNAPAHFIYLRNSVFMQNWTSFSWSSLTTFWCIRRVWKNMKNTSELRFNICESTSYAKFRKCEFWIQEVPFPHHVVSPEGIAVEPGKVKEVLEWKPSTSVSEVHSFLGLVVYYQRFIPNFSKIA